MIKNKYEGLVIWITCAQPLVIKRLGIGDLRLADSNNKETCRRQGIQWQERGKRNADSHS